MSLARIVSNQSRAILVIVALLCAAGLYAAWRLPVAILPETDFPRIVIIADNGEAPASQTLVSVTRPIEEAMNGVPGIARIKSKTARGSSEISLYFDWGVNIVQVLQLVQARLSSPDGPTNRGFPNPTKGRDALLALASWRRDLREAAVGSTVMA